MTENEKWNYINQLESDLLKGGTILSEWTSFLVKDSHLAYCSGAYLSSILSSQSAIECHLRYDYYSTESTKKLGFYALIEKLEISPKLKEDLHELRIFRNKWVHVNDPNNDSDLLERPKYYEEELLQFATKTIKTTLTIVLLNQFV